MAGDSVPFKKKATTKDKAKAKLGQRIGKERQVKRLRAAKLQKEHKRSAASEEPKKAPLLLRSEADAGGPSSKKPRRDSGYTDRMNVDDFMDGGFMQTMDELEGEDSNDDEEEEPAPAPASKGKRKAEESAPKHGKASQHAADIAALEKNDPDFYKFLKEQNSELLNFEGEEDEDEEEEEVEEEEEEVPKAAKKKPAQRAAPVVEEEEEDDDDDVDDEEEEEDDESDEDDEDEDEMAAPPAKEAKPVVLIEVTSTMVKGWQATLKGKKDTPTLKEVVSAFRAAVRFGDTNDASRDDVFTYTSGAVFNQLMQFCLQSMDGMLRRHVAGSAEAAAKAPKTKAGVERPDQWTHWRKHQVIVKSYLTSLLQFVGQLTEASMLTVTLQQLHRLLPFYFCLPKLCPKLLKGLVKVWAVTPGDQSGSQQNTLLSFAIVRQLASSLPYPFIEHSLKAVYLAYAGASRVVNRNTLQHLVLLSSCVVDLCSLDPQAAYQHAFVYIRQLAVHLRNAIIKATPEASRQVYNWQYVNCLRVWAQVLCAHARQPGSPMRQLVYPLVQVTIGAAKLLPSIRYAPLRFQCARILNQLCSELGIYVSARPPNLAPIIARRNAHATLCSPSQPAAYCLRSLFPMSGPLTSTAHTACWPEPAPALTSGATRYSTVAVRPPSRAPLLSCVAQTPTRLRTPPHASARLRTPPHAFPRLRTPPHAPHAHLLWALLRRPPDTTPCTTPCTTHGPRARARPRPRLATVRRRCRWRRCSSRRSSSRGSRRRPRTRARSDPSTGRCSSRSRPPTRRRRSTRRASSKRRSTCSASTCSPSAARSPSLRLWAPRCSPCARKPRAPRSSPSRSGASG